MQEDDALSKREKLLLMLEWYNDKPPLSCLEEALEALIAFATRSEEQPEQRQEHSGRKTTDRVLSWQYDAAYVYAAFLSVYHMDLQQEEQMHWHLLQKKQQKNNKKKNTKKNKQKTKKRMYGGGSGRFRIASAFRSRSWTVINAVRFLDR